MDVGTEQLLQHLLQAATTSSSWSNLVTSSCCRLNARSCCVSPRCTDRRLADLAEVGVGGRVEREVTVEHLGIAEDHRQDVVEVMRHPTREATHRLHLL
jgi:hypothetical protein